MTDLLIPGGANLLHIGPHKTGSTAIQVALHEARAQIAEHGVHYAGRTVRPKKAGWALGVRGRPAGTEQPPMKHWDILVDDVAGAAEQRVCISNEDFGRAEPDQARHIVEGLGGSKVHVVAVARRLDRYLPSQWQERVKAGDRRDYDAWLRVVLDRMDETVTWDKQVPGFNWDRTNVLYAHDPLALASRWADVVGAERFTLVASDDRDRRLLPATFERMLGLPDESLVLYPDRSNRSLNWTEIEVVRAVNDRLLARGVTRLQLRELVARGLVPALRDRETPSPGDRTPPLPGWAADAVREFADSRVAGLRELGVQVVGDLGALLVPPLEEVERPRPTLSAEDAALAVEAVLAASGWFGEAADTAPN